jgi:hypothetical protein
VGGTHGRQVAELQDARPYINRIEDPYDVILGDVFNAHYSIPFHLTTEETLPRLHALLAEDGLVILNTIAAIEGDGADFYGRNTTPTKPFFPKFTCFPSNQAPSDGQAIQNVMLVACKSHAPWNTPRRIPNWPIFSADSGLTRFLGMFLS